jgi:FMN phosphatase YigB (HAD superfamily)
MKIIFDFDDVLFDTKSLKKRVFSGLTEYGVNKDLVENIYQGQRDEFNVEKLYREVCVESHITMSEEEINKAINEVLKDLIVFTDARFIQKIKELGGENCFILTAGEESFQKFKIKASGFLDVIPQDNIIIVPQDKKEIIRQICTTHASESIIFVDDKNKNIEEATSLKMPNLFPVFYEEQSFEALDEIISFCNNRDRELLRHVSIPMR